jgi:flavin-dependent dehydrogenase
VYDVIIVGARCAGSPTAMLLARQGYRVLLLDRATFPSDRVISTHLIHPPGMAYLKSWGLLDAVRSGCPAVGTYELHIGPVGVSSKPPAVDGVAAGYSPSREVLDQLLVEAAVKAGAELRERVSVQGVLSDDAGVVGVTGHSKGGTRVVERARIVVGADGKFSKIAKFVGATEYNARPVLSKSLWTYWDGVDLRGTAMAFRRNYKHAFTWPTHDGLVIAGVAWPTRDFVALEDDAADRVLLETFDELAPELAPQLRANKRARRWMIGSVPNFFRTSYGPGWALVGDAAYNKDPITAAGITDAFRGAEQLAAAIADGLSGRVAIAEALAGYQRRRDTAVLAHYAYTCDYARVSPYSTAEVELIQAMSESPRHGPALAGLFAGIVSPEEFFSRESIHELYDYMPPGHGVSWESRVVRWLIKGLPGRFDGSVRLADRLIANKMGEMGKFLLASPRG